ncbi:MAG TPA: mechanosensitive ion channel family protein, partial [Isosphaeraceae bacterium]
VMVAVSCQVYLVGSSETLTQLLAGLGLVGLAASLAAQDTLKNFFGTLLLIGEHPFRIGDYVIIQGMEGLVESVGFRSTRLRTFEDSLLTIPNSVMASASIDNRGARASRRYRTVVGLAYATPPDRLVALRDALRAFALAHPRVLPGNVEVHIAELGPSSVDLLVQVYFRVATYSDEMSCRDEFSREILRQAERLGVTIAFPTRTIHLAGSGVGATGHEVPPTPKLLGRERPEPQRPRISDPAEGGR